MAQVAVKFTGIENLRERLTLLDKGMRKELRQVFVEVTKQILEKSQPLVPVESGALKRSGRVSVRVGEKQLTAKVLYGGPKVPYALVIHERLDLKHPNGGQAKYLETVARTFPFAEKIGERFSLGRAAKG